MSISSMTSWSEQVFRYCERARDAAFWAEPFNAVSNAGFLVVAIWGLLRLRRLRSEASQSPAGTALLATLVGLTAAIGVGSFLFHTFATRWSRLADVVPIAAFMACYLAFALRVFLGLPPWRIALCLGAFLAASVLMSSIACPVSLASATRFAREPCLKGTMGYVPALAALVLVGSLVRKRHAAGHMLTIAAGLLLLAMLMRWLDARSCTTVILFGRPRGTHALWHLINAATLAVLLSAAFDALGRRRAA
jgi:hypothetical protein